VSVLGTVIFLTFQPTSVTTLCAVLELLIQLGCVKNRSEHGFGPEKVQIRVKFANVKLCLVNLYLKHHRTDPNFQHLLV
jgi:hypothetical protein